VRSCVSDDDSAAGRRPGGTTTDHRAAATAVGRTSLVRAAGIFSRDPWFACHAAWPIPPVTSKQAWTPESVGFVTSRQVVFRQVTGDP